ncbi:6f29eba7-2e42-4ddc-a3df-0456b3be11e5, partial [Thermothielavioides terrestris]
QLDPGVCDEAKSRFQDALARELCGPHIQPKPLVGWTDGRPYGRRPCQLSAMFRTSAAAIMRIERIDDMPTGDCHGHVVRRCLADKDQRKRIEKADCVCQRPPQARLEAERPQEPHTVCRRGFFRANRVNSRPMFELLKILQHPDRFTGCAPFLATLSHRAAKKDSLPTADGLRDRDQWWTAIWLTGAERMGIGVWPKAGSCRATTPPMCPRRIG